MSRVSKQNLCVIGASSQIIRSTNFSSSAASEPYSMLQIEFSMVGIGILNFECVVLPPGNNKDAIPLDATVNTIFLLDLNAEERVLHMKVFHVPP